MLQSSGQQGQDSQPSGSCLTNLRLTPRCERAVRASHAIGARRRSGAREGVSGSPRGEAPRIETGPTVTGARDATESIE